MTDLDYGKWRCEYGTWHGLDEKCRCTSPAFYLAPGLTPTALPADRPGVTVRYSVDEQFRLDLRAVLNHPAETIVRRPIFAKEYSL